MDLLRHLQYFVAVAEHRNFGRAAASLGVTQPPVSQGVKRLETQLGLRLVERNPAGATVTRHGAALLPRARLIVDDAARFLDEARLISGGTNRVRWGIDAQVDDEMTARCVASLRGSSADGGAEVTTVTAPAGELIEGVRRGALDVAVVEHPAMLDGVEAGPVVKLPRRLVVPAEHEVATAEQPRVRMLAGLSLATVPRSANPPAHDLLLDSLRRRGIDPPVVTAAGHRAVAVAVSAGGCFGVATAGAPVHTGTVHRRLLGEEVALRVRVIAGPGIPGELVSALDRVLVRGWR